MNQDSKIVSADVGRMPQNLMDAMPVVTAGLDDGSKVELFSYYPDEIRFSPEEFVGLTVTGAHALRRKKDVAYLQS